MANEITKPEAHVEEIIEQTNTKIEIEDDGTVLIASNASPRFSQPVFT